MAHNPHSRRRPLSTAFFPPTAKLPLDPFAHMAPATWDVHISSLKSLESAMQNVVLIVGDPEPLSLRPVLSSPVLSQSLVILISHNPPSVDDIHNVLQQSPTPGVQYPTLYLVKIATPAILLGALRLVRVLERAQVLARAWRKNMTAFAFAERTRRYHYAKGHAAQPSTASGSSSASHSPPPPSTIIRIVLFAEQPPLDSSEFIPVNEYGIEIIPAASSRSSTLFNGWLGGRRQRYNSGIYGIHTQGGSEVIMSKPNTSKLSLALSLPVRMPRMGRRLSKMGAPSSDRPTTSPTLLLKHDPTHRPFDVVMSFLPPPETRYTVASLPPPAASSPSLPFRKTPKSGSQKQTTEVVAISEKVLLKHTILMTTLVSPFIVDAVLTSGMSMRQLGNALPSVQVSDVGTGASPVSTKHRTWNPKQENTGTNHSAPPTFGSLATGSFGRVKGRILHVLPSGSNDAGEKTKLASSMEQFIIGYGMSAGAGANAGSSAPNLHTSSPPPSRGSTSSASTSASNSPLQQGLDSRSPFSSMLPTPSTSRTSTASSVHQVTIATTSASGDLTKPISYVLPASALGEVVYTPKADDHEEHREDGWDVVPSISHRSRAGSHGRAVTILDCVVSGVLDDAAHTFPIGLGGSGARAWIGGKKDFSVEGAPIESDSLDVLDGIDVDAELQGRTRKRSEMDRARDREKGKEREREKALPAPPATTPSKTRSHTALPQQAESSSLKTQSPSMLVPPPMVRQRAQSQDHSTPHSSHSHRSPQHLAPPTTGTSLLPMDAFQAGYQGGFQAGYQAVKTNASHSPLGEGRTSKRHSHQPHPASRSTSQPHPKSQLQPQPQPQYQLQPSPAEVPHSRQANRSRAQSQSTGEGYSQPLAMSSINSVIAFPTTASPTKPLGAATWGTGTSSPLRIPSTDKHVASAPPPTPLAGVEAYLQPQLPPQVYVSQPQRSPTDIKVHAESRPAHRPPLVSRDTGLSDTSVTTGPSSTSASASGHGSRHGHSDADRGRAGYTHSLSRGESGSAIYVSSSAHKHGRGDVRDGSRDRRTREEERRRGWEGEHRHHRPEEPKYHSSRRSHEERSRRRESERDNDKDREKRREEKEIRREERRRREDKEKRREERDKESRREHRRSDKERVEKDRHMESTSRRHRSASHSHSHSHSVSQTRSTSHHHHHHHPSEAEVYSSSRRKEEREGKRSPSRPTSTRDVGGGGGLGLPTPPDSSSSTSSCEAGLPNGAVARAEC